jgi:hypothetical protein
VHEIKALQHSAPALETDQMAQSLIPTCKLHTGAVPNESFLHLMKGHWSSVSEDLPVLLFIFPPQRPNDNLVHRPRQDPLYSIQPRPQLFLLFSLLAIRRSKKKAKVGALLPSSPSFVLLRSCSRAFLAIEHRASPAADQLVITWLVSLSRWYRRHCPTARSSTPSGQCI